MGDEAGLLEFSPVYYPQTTLLPTHLYFTVRVLVVNSPPVLLGWKNVLLTRVNHVISVALIFWSFAIPSFIKLVYYLTWAIVFAL